MYTYIHTYILFGIWNTKGKILRYTDALSIQNMKGATFESIIRFRIHSIFHRKEEQIYFIFIFASIDAAQPISFEIRAKLMTFQSLLREKFLINSHLVDSFFGSEAQEIGLFEVDLANSNDLNYYFYSRFRRTKFNYFSIESQD